MAKKEKSIYIQDDVIRDLEQDNFGHKHIAHAVIDSLMNTKPPFIVGIFGGWGTGKSSLLGIIKSNLPPNKTVTVTIDAWRYTSADNLRRAFLIHVAEELAPKYLKDLRLRLYTSEQETKSTVQSHFNISESKSIKEKSIGFIKTILKIITAFIGLSLIFLLFLYFLFIAISFLNDSNGTIAEYLFTKFDWTLVSANCGSRSYRNEHPEAQNLTN